MSSGSGASNIPICAVSESLIGPDGIRPVLETRSRTREIASGTERIRSPLSHTGTSVIPRSCLMISFGSTPDRSASDARRDMPSDMAASFPPALPSVANISNGRPSDATLTVTYRGPRPVRIRLVTPCNDAGRSRGTENCGITFRLDSSSTSPEFALSDVPVARTSLSRLPER